jgi:hypothetical protein
MKRILFFIAVILLYCCDTVDIQLKLVNLSNKEIVCASDVLIKQEYFDSVEYYLNHTTGPKSIKEFECFCGKAGWRGKIERSTNKKAYVYVFSVDTLKKYINLYSMDELVARNLCDTIFSYSVSDLDRMDWKILYYGK